MATKKYIQLNSDGTLLEDTENLITASELIASGGAVLVGVDDSSLVEISGSDLQSIIESIDAAIASKGEVLSVNGLTGNVVLSANDVAADHTAINYTPSNANIDGHLAGIDTVLASISSPFNYLGSFDASAGNYNAISGARVGDYYKVSVAGTIGAVSYLVGDAIIVNKDVVGVPTAADVDKIDNTEPINSVNGQIGTVVLTTDDINSDADLSNVPDSPPANNILTSQLESIAQNLVSLGIDNFKYGLQAGVSLNAGDPVYIDVVTNKLAKCRADDETCLAFLGFVESPAAINDKPRVVKAGNSGNIFAGLTAGLPVYIAPTGGITQTQPTTSGHFSVRVGVATSPLNVRLEPINTGVKRA